MKKKLLAACLLISMLAGSTPVFAAPSKPQLKEIGQISDANGDMRFSGSSHLTYKDKGDQKMFCDPTGKEFPELLFDKSTYLAGDLWELDRQGAEVPESCVINSDGTVLIPWSLCVIDVENENYLEVIFGEEKTENKDEAMMYVSPNMFTIGFPGDEDVLFKGKKQLFDVKGEKLLTDCIFTDPSQSFEVCGTSYIASDRENAPRILDASGNVLAEDASGVYVQNDLYTYSKEGVLYVFDDTVTQIAQSDKANSVIADGLFGFHGDNDMNGVMAFDGTVLVEPSFQNTPRAISDNLLETTTKNDAGDYLHGLLDRTGKTILEPKYYSVSEIGGGFAYAKETKDTETTLFIAPDGRIISDRVKGYTNSDLTAPVDDGKYVIINSGEILDLTGKEGFSGIEGGILVARDADKRLYGAYEMFDGTQILDYEWEKIDYAYGHVYAYKDGAWHIFSI